MKDEGDVESDIESNGSSNEPSDEIYETETESTGIESDENITVPPQRYNKYNLYFLFGLIF